MRFSERLGYIPPKIALEESDLPDSLKVRLWNLIDVSFMQNITAIGSSIKCSEEFHLILSVLYCNYMNKTLDSIKIASHAKIEVREEFMRSPFPHFYDLLELFYNLSLHKYFKGRDFDVRCNDVFEVEKCAFRFVAGKLSRIVDESERVEIQRAVEIDSFYGAGEHIKRSLELYSDRSSPDYRNAVREAISAVEATAKYITKDEKATLGGALNKIESKYNIHPALKDGFKKIYGYTSDANGIRHSLLEESSVSDAEARMMIVSCSAFVNYLLSISS